MTPNGGPDLRSWLKAIGTVTAAVNAERDLKSLLDLVAATAHDLLDLSFCAIMLPDDEVEYLSVAGASGLPDQYITRINRERPVRLESDTLTGAPASRAFRSGKPSMISDMSTEAGSTWAEAPISQGYRSILVVPLLTSNGVLGTLNSYRTHPYVFPSSEIEQLELLAEHATIALTSARVLDDLRDKHRSIVRSEEIHERLLNIAVHSGGVRGIASALHDLLRSVVVIRDQYGATLVSEPETAADDHCAPTASSSRPIVGSTLVREVDEDVVADVMLDGSGVGTVWLPGRAGTLDALGVRAMEHGSLVLSLELLRQRTAAEVEQTLRGELLADLLSGADPRSPTVRDRATLMGHNLNVPHRMMVATTRGRVVRGRAVRDDASIAQRAAAEAVRVTSRMKPRPLIAAIRDSIVALWPDLSGEQPGEQTLRRAISSSLGADAAATAMVAVTDLGNDGIPAAYRGARGVLAFAGHDRDVHTVVTFDDLGAAGLLLQFAAPAELRRYAERTVGVLCRYDADHGAELFRTLRTYLDCDLDRRTTAEVLVLHPNTVSQRLRRVETMTGLNLRSPRSVIEARTALMLHDVADAIGGGHLV